MQSVSIIQNIRQNRTVWLLATLPLLIRTILTLLLPGAHYTLLLYTLLCVFFLIVDYRNWKVSPDYSIYTFLIGILILPYYLYLRRDNNGQKIHGPLAAWVILFICMLAAASI